MAENSSSSSNKLKNYFLNFLIIIVALVTIYLFYNFIKHTTSSSSETLKKESVDTTGRNITRQPGSKTLQIDVQNGCGITGIADKFTDYLRANGFDVVEMGNYNNSDVQQTMVIDRAGNIKNAKLLAGSLGVSEKQVIQQMNKNYFLDATVVIGKDYQQLNPFKTK